MTNSTVQGLLTFLQCSPSPFHACSKLAEMFTAYGFHRLDEKQDWSLSEGQKYFYTRSDSSIVAFHCGKDLAENGLRLVGAHTDSPCLKVKPTPELHKNGFFLLGVEVYGGALLNPWFDRDLGIAGKVTGIKQNGELGSTLIDFEKAVAVVPSLAIHLNRTANENKTVNPQREMNALLGSDGEIKSFRDLLLRKVNAGKDTKNFKEVLDFNLSFYDMQPPAIIGLNDEFIASARLDNLLSCYLAAESLVISKSDQTTVLVCNDHEEVGSRSEPGAQGTLLNDLFARLCPDATVRQKMLRRSLMLSIDNAHGRHPNYPDKHDDSHGPVINEGPVLKFDADQSYATSSETAAFVRWLAAQDKAIPLQSFVTRADMRCGSTIGPITATNSGIKTVDIGNPQFAMHSCRELAGVEDTEYMRSLIDRFYQVETLPF